MDIQNFSTCFHQKLVVLADKAPQGQSRGQHHNKTAKQQQRQLSLKIGETKRCADQLCQKTADFHGKTKNRAYNDAGIGRNQLHQLTGFFLP